MYFDNCFSRLYRVLRNIWDHIGQIWAPVRVVSPGHSQPDLAQIKPIGPHSSRPGQCKYTRGKLKRSNKNQYW